MLCGISVTFPVSTRKWNNWNNVTKSSLNFFFCFLPLKRIPSLSRIHKRGLLSNAITGEMLRPPSLFDYAPLVCCWYDKSLPEREEKTFLLPPLFSFPRGACRARWKWGNWIAPVGLFSLCGRPARVRRPGQVHAPSLPFASLSSSRAREKLGLQSPLKRSDDLGLWSKTLSLKHTQGKRT